ncbi:hypothetical protein A2716_02285 [candidate division WWE3 bacterium RIFCSPHIGHO2_01_FULL_40_23]|uniref:Polymerase nucleotidyl transferase domain-containing protein n=1 Tax=candidate division WWE3 bacterium RIFCSPLOWO2_01_FULL_41_18 TaxID=1802625 RepID=A0A1F4VGG3_UNCKA|nr:MAG: hypothetical protein A2716_02285 [candidate division WWE3 bacterium RIFCSPHIGHO2_01_FULL_40_23]OGC55813.1 MAG: hypothetical protein A3A78_02135 [candidate division WWE3 bacterium RIFCSPLOWO2_01_FULL_41_18]
MDRKTLLRDEPKNLIKTLRKAFQANGVPVDKIIIFGSYAKKTNRPDSDLDLCVVSKSFGKDSLKEMMELTKISSRIDPMIEIHPYNPQDLNNKFDPLAKEIREHGILGY